MNGTQLHQGRLVPGILVLLATTVLLSAGLATVAGAQPRKEPEPRLDIVVAVLTVADAAEAVAPDAKVWKKAAEQTVPLQPQQFVEPFQDTAGVASVNVRAVRDGQRLAVLMEWADKGQDTAIGPTGFTDGCAVMFAAAATPPSVMMGETGRPVRIFNWKAAWQKPSELSPFAWVDVVPLSGVAGPVRPDSAVYASAARANTGGWAIGNPVSGPNYRSVVEELAAEGPGSITHKAFAPGGGGVWKKGTWRVALLLPGELAGSRPVAFAVWDGGQRDVGGRKSISPWVSLRAEP